MRSKVFRSGNSNAVRLPAAIAYPVNTEVEITRHGDTVMIRPAVGGSMKDLVAVLRSLPVPEPIGPIERTRTRDAPWDK